MVFISRRRLHFERIGPVRRQGYPEIDFHFFSDSMRSAGIRTSCVGRVPHLNQSSSSFASVASSDDAMIKQEHSQWFASRLSKLVPRERQIDPLSRATPVDPKEIVELDYMSMCGLRTNELPTELRDKVIQLLDRFGYKGDLERFGKYMVARYRSRSCAESPSVLASSLDRRERLRVVKSPIDRLLTSKGFADLRAASPELFDEESFAKLNGDFAQTAMANAEDGKHLLSRQMFYSPGTAVTYVAHRFPSTFAANFRIMTEVLKRVPDFNPSRILDYGSGPAVSALAAVQVWGNQKQVTCIEPSQNMQQLGKFLLADSGASVEWRSALYGESHEKFDLITLSYVLMEIRDSASRDLLVKNLLDRLGPNGVLLIVECGTPTGFRFLHRIRENFIGTNSGHILAPCPHEGACPLAMTGKDWCHFDQRVLRLPHYVYAKGSKAKNTEFEKFSYLVLRKGGQSPRAKYTSEALAPTSWEKSFFWPRVVMPAIRAGGHTLIDVCAGPGQFERLTVSKSKPHGSGFRFSRKLLWGDLWRYPKRLARYEAREGSAEHAQKLRNEASRARRGAPDNKKVEQTFYGN